MEMSTHPRSQSSMAKQNVKVKKNAPN
jgi:hypothetical protein